MNDKIRKAAIEIMKLVSQKEACFTVEDIEELIRKAMHEDD